MFSVQFTQLSDVLPNIIELKITIFYFLEINPEQKNEFVIVINIILRNLIQNDIEVDLNVEINVNSFFFGLFNLKHEIDSKNQQNSQCKEVYYCIKFRSMILFESILICKSVKNIQKFVI